MQHIIKSITEFSAISKSFGINIAHPKRESIAFRFSFSLSLIQQVLRSLKEIGTIAPYFLSSKVKMQFSGSSSALFNPNLGIKFPLNIHKIIR